jgi:hypothetical protein
MSDGMGSCKSCRDSYCEPCPGCGSCSSVFCDCKPPVSTAFADEGYCDSCRLPIREGDPIYRWEDALTHALCPTRAQA